MLRTVAFLALIALAAVTPAAEPVPTGSFSFTFDTVLQAPPAEAWAAATGDVSGWWDHSMSGDPHRMVIEPKPGGVFLEEFDASGDGVVHADVTYVRTGEMLRMVGPLGLAGHALHMVTTWTFAPGDADGTTVLTVKVNASGEVHEGWGEIVETTWRHFIGDRLAPFVAGTLKD